MAKVPSWVWATLAMDRAVSASARAAHVLVEEALGGLLDEAQRDAVTAHVYGGQASYRPRGASFEHGLFDWEERALTCAAFPDGGRLLVGGAGGGRELVALVARGFDVVAFEPSDLVGAAAELAGGLRGATVVRASFDDLVRAVDGRCGPLAPHLQRFDGVLLGWTSLMHVTSARSREALFRALRSCAPDAKVIASFWVRRDEGSRLRGRIARGLALVGARPEPGVRFARQAGFYHPLDRGELEALAARTGYALELYDERGCGHVVLAPA